MSRGYSEAGGVADRANPAEARTVTRYTIAFSRKRVHVFYGNVKSYMFYRMILYAIFQNNVFQNLRISAVSTDGMVEKRHV